MSRNILGRARLFDVGGLVAAVAVITVVALPACGGPPPRMQNPTKEDGVAANSASEDRLAGEGKPKPAPAPAQEDPSQPYTVPVGGAPEAAAGTDGSSTTGKAGAKGGTKTVVAHEASTPAGKDPPAGKATGKVTHAECKQTFDKYIDLTLGSDSRFEGIPPEMVKQLKEQALSQAQSQKGDPCSTQQVTRRQYDCAMSAASTNAWQRCMK